MQKLWVQLPSDSRDSGSTKGRSDNLKSYICYPGCLTSSQLSELPTTSSNHRFGVRIHHCRDDPLFHACTDVPPFLLCDSVCQMKRISSAPDPQTTCSVVSGCTTGLTSFPCGSPKGQDETVTLPSHPTVT